MSAGIRGSEEHRGKRGVQVLLAKPACLAALQKGCAHSHIVFLKLLELTCRRYKHLHVLCTFVAETVNAPICASAVKAEGAEPEPTDAQGDAGARPANS